MQRSSESIASLAAALARAQAELILREVVDYLLNLKAFRTASACSFVALLLETASCSPVRAIGSYACASTIIAYH